MRTAEEEFWKDIIGYEGQYQISNLGRVKGLTRKSYRYLIPNAVLKEKFLSPGMRVGYRFVRLTKNGITKNFTIHRLIGIHFIPNPNNYPVMNHINSDRLDNRIENLEWCTYAHNNKHAYTHGFNYSNRSQVGRVGKLSGHNKPILQFSLDNIFIKEWDCAADIKRQLGFDFRNVSACCRKKIKRVYGFIWKFKSELSSNQYSQLKNDVSK